MECAPNPADTGVPEQEHSLTHYRSRIDTNDNGIKAVPEDSVVLAKRTDRRAVIKSTYPTTSSEVLTPNAVSATVTPSRLRAL